MRTYEKAETDVNRRAKALIKQYHPDVGGAGVTIDFLYARNDMGPAVSHQGYPALAVCRVVNLKDRSKGMADVEITIDAEHYVGMSDEQRDALLDHEIKHIALVMDNEGKMKTDDLGRPKVKMRKHDYQFGWFAEIARRHGKNSPEVYQARLIWDNDGQVFWPGIAGANPKIAAVAPFDWKAVKAHYLETRSIKGTAEKFTTPENPLNENTLKARIRREKWSQE